MKKRTVILIASLSVLTALFIGGFFLLEHNRRIMDVPDNGETMANAGDPAPEPLFMSLADTVTDRNVFMETYAEAKDKLHLRSLYEEYLPRIGANGLIDSIESVTPLCHDEGHDLGKVLYANIQDVGPALAVCHDACSSGCMHGVLMEFFSTGTNAVSEDEHASLETVTSQMSAFCQSSAVSSQYLPGDCAHGIGHTLMFLADYNIDSAIQACDTFDTYPMQYYCATGAYMEYNNARFDADYQTQSTLYPCDISPYPAACFRYKMVGVFQRHYASGGSFFAIRDQCLALTDPNIQLGCFHGIGNAHMSLIARDQLKVTQVCGMGTDQQISACIDGMMERLGKYYPLLVEERCETLEDGWKKDLCLDAGERKMYDLTKSFDLYQR